MPGQKENRPICLEVERKKVTLPIDKSHGTQKFDGYGNEATETTARGHTDLLKHH